MLEKNIMESLNIMQQHKPFNITRSNLPVLVQKLNDLVEQEGNWQVLIKERNSDRSVEQNARLWDLYTSVGNYLGYTAQEVHELMGYKFLLTEKNIGREKITRIVSTTKLSVKEMNEYQQKIEAYCSNLGWGW
jgi:hypothetical protein